MHQVLRYIAQGRCCTVQDLTHTPPSPQNTVRCRCYTAREHLHMQPFRCRVLTVNHQERTAARQAPAALPLPYLDCPQETEAEAEAAQDWPSWHLYRPEVPKGQHLRHQFQHRVPQFFRLNP